MGVLRVFGTVSGAEKRGVEDAKITFPKKKGRKSRKKTDILWKQSESSAKYIFVAVFTLV